MSLASAYAAPAAQAISICGVSFGYGEAPFVLKDIGLEVATGEFVSIVGPSGCGKSTLLYLIGGFVPFDHGAIEIGGRPVTGPSPNCGIVFQQFALFPWKTVLGNVLYGLEKQRRLAHAEGSRGPAS